mmetsp:Transcript_34394/g.67762  ORF Transcript_34394/g.67762 Transcript_34394/m.67762 type:complete len:599 (+) Transcript_34394:146-1942(+)|eukprot:CAMPEP_0172668110 /NCGR_PEP_ID=MMETSP1074-20121228/8851_1 /TAXON_ID=2916 /ORGANISM="Ceratium fusus, Strain PA161109" /LENGTH=598 /DNA_ID=CAMNT_0013484717 /DNA_START=69 /DNA_END=1865 /DNA_ORIENTATION=-
MAGVSVPERKDDTRAYSLLEGNTAGAEKMGLEDLNGMYINKAFQALADREARNHGRQPGECPEADLRAVYYTDAWDECHFHVGPFVLTYVYELLPSLISQFLVHAIEGRASVKNRLLDYPCPGLLFDLIFRSWWLLLLLFLVWKPPGCHAFNVAVAGVLFSFRCMCIAMKYAYLPESDLRLVQTFSRWRDNMHIFRNLGGAMHFNMTNTFEIDVMKELMTAALRADVLDTLSTCCFSFTPLAARTVWEPVKLTLAKCEDDEYVKASGMAPAKSSDFVASKFGNTKARIGLADLSSIEAEVSEGKLRAGVLAYYLALREYGPTSKFLLLGSILMTLAMTSVRPLLRFMFEDASNDTIKSTIFLCILSWTELSTIFLFNSYLLYVILDSKKRAQICQALLASIGHKQVRACRLIQGFEDIALPLKTVGDMLAFWATQRVLGPEIFRGLSIRYNSGYVLVGTMHLLALSGVLLLLDAGKHDMGLIYTIGSQVMVIFLVGVVAVCISALIAQGTNTSVALVQKVIDRAALDSILDQKAEDVTKLNGLLCGNLEDVAPVKILYMPANSQIVTSIIAAFGFLAHSVFKSLLRELHVPDLVFELI